MRRCAATAPDRRVPSAAASCSRAGAVAASTRARSRCAAATEAARRARSVSLSVTACSAILRSPRSSARSGSNHSGISQRAVGAGRCRAASSGCWWARVRRWVTAGMSARSKARIVSRVSLASATSVLSVTTQSRLCVAAAGGGDVQAAAGRHRRDEREAVVDGVGLVAVLGRRVAQPDVVVDVVGGQGDGAVSLFTGHGQRTIGPDRRDGPGFPVADRLAGRGDQGAVVAAGGDNVADVSAFAAGDRRDPVRVEVSGGDSGGLDGVVDGVDMIIRGGDEGDGVAARVVLDPHVGRSRRGDRRGCRG